MARRHSLRFRVAAAFAGLGAALSLLLATGIWFAAHDVSQRLIDQTLKAELEDYMARRARNPNSLPPNTASLRGYLQSADTGSTVPEALRALPSGQHDVVLEAIPYRLGIGERGSERYLILFSMERQNAREQRFLVYLIIAAGLMTVLASVGGAWLAGRVIAPVTELAHAVSAAPADSPPRLAGADEPDDEIAELAGAFDQYLSRLAAFIERERAFTADASHELRTPLAVIRGAAEVLADDPALSDEQRMRLDRIQRAVADMSDLLSALLTLAREEVTPEEHSCDAVAVTHKVLARHQSQASARDTQVMLNAPAPVMLPVPDALFAIVVANLLQNAIAHTQRGLVSVSLDATGLDIADSGVGLPETERALLFQRFYRGPASSGSGIGLSIVKRICDRQGWRITLDDRPEGGTRARLSFSA